MSVWRVRDRRWLVRSAVMIGAASVGLTAPVAAQTTQQRQPTLQERLVFGLQVRRPSEFEFVTAVVDTVGRGELPQQVVDRVFAYARRRRDRDRRVRRPIIFFQPALLRVVEPMKVEIKADP